jgi:hypothetical protein
MADYWAALRIEDESIAGRNLECANAEPVPGTPVELVH